MQKMIKTLTAGLLATTALTSAALAGGSLKDSAAPEGRKFAWSFNVGGTTDYVFRGVSQNNEDPALQVGFDVSYGMLYAGVWSSMVAFGPWQTGLGDVVSAEVDLYAGIKPTWGPLNFDFGVIYYAYPGARDGAGSLWFEQDYVELKAGVSGSPFKNLTTGLTVFYSPDYNNESGNAWTIEGVAAYELPKLGPITPTLSGTLGTTLFENLALAQRYNTAMGDDAYLYWNVGMAFAVDKLTLDFRYWDTDMSGGTPCSNPTGLQCDERFVFSAKVTLP
jgi:uncharacterized protein (TIGR02001 family)